MVAPPSRDELVLEEDEARAELGRIRSRVTRLGQERKRAQDTLETAQRNLSIAEEQHQFLKSTAPIVLLSEYELVIKVRDDNKQLITTINSELLRIARDIQAAEDNVGALERHVTLLQKQIKSWGKLIQLQKA